MLIASIYSTAALTQINHASFHPDSGYSLKAEGFINHTFKDESLEYSLPKFKSFLNRLHRERDFIIDQIYETKKLEELELRIEDNKKINEEALEVYEEAAKEKNEYSILFNQFLIPMITQSIQAFHLDFYQRDQVIDGLLDQFNLAYSAIYSPDIYRTRIPHDVALFHTIKHFRGFKIAVKDHAPEANNLSFLPKQKGKIESCLQKQIGKQHFFTIVELNQLENCNIDLSTLNPSHSPLWSGANKNYQEIKTTQEKLDLFPDEDDLPIFTYKKLRFSGLGSPKLTVSFKHRGEKRNIKLKLGTEVHIDPIIAALGKMIGLYQDETKYYPEVKIKFKSEKKYNEFTQQMIKKYKTRIHNYLVKEERIDGEVYATLRYVLLEANHPQITKLNPIDQSGWDFLNRREFRGMLLWFAWVNMRDTRSGNWRAQLFHDNDKIIPQIIFQDTGKALGGSAAFDKNPLDLITIASQNTFINQFETNFLSYEDEGESLRVRWVDGFKNPDIFTTTTFNDLKWMARRIANLSIEDIQYALTLGGMPNEMQYIYFQKLIKRRNQIVTTFHLENEYDLFDSINLNNYQVPGLVENGKYIVPSVNGINRFQLDTNPLHYVSQLLQFHVPLTQLNQDISLGLGKEIGIEAGLYTDKIPEVISGKTKTYLHPGIKFKITRSIPRIRFQQFMDDSQRFFTHDRVEVSLDLRFGLLKELIDEFPINIQTSLKTLQFSFNHYRPAATLKEAIGNPFKIHQILNNMSEYSSQKMLAGEIFSFSSGHGIDLSVTGNYQNFVQVQSGVETIWSSPKYIHRNHFGELEFFEDHREEIRYYLNSKLGWDFKFLFLSLTGMSLNHSKMTGEAQMTKFFSQSRDKDYQDSSISQIFRKIESEAVHNFLNGNMGAIPQLRTEYKLNYVMERNDSYFHFFILNQRLRSEFATFNLEDHRGKTKSFLRYFKGEQDDIGFPSFGLGGVTYFKGDQSQIEVQLERGEMKELLAINNVYDYEGTLNRKRLIRFIKKLNQLYSKSSSEQFFRYDLLPDKELVDKYKKILNHQRIFLYAQKLMKNLKDNHSFIDQKIKEVAFALDGTSHPLRRRERTKEKLSFIERYLKKMKSAKEEGDEVLLTRSFGNLIRELELSKYGLKLVRPLFEDDQVYVTGEIYGVLDSMNLMHEKHTNSVTRRYMGTSWGEYRETPPIWKFLNKNPIFTTALPELSNIRDDQDLYGVLPAGEVVIR